MSRFNWLLAAIAAVLVLLNLWSSAPRVIEREATGPVFDELALDLDRAHSIRLTRGEEELHLMRQGGEWVVAQAFGFPAESHPVEQLLARLGRLSFADREGRRGTQDFYGFQSESAVRIDVRDASDHPLVEALQGRGSQDGPTRGSFLTLLDAETSGGEAVFAAAELPPLDLAPRRWWRGRLIEREAKLVTGLMWTRPGGEALQLRRVKNVWRQVNSPEGGAPSLGRAVNSLTCSQLSNVLTSLYHVGVVRSEPCEDMGFGEPLRSLTLELKGDEQGTSTQVELQLAGRSESGGRYACTDDLERPFVVELSAESVAEVEALVESLEVRLLSSE